MIKLSTSLLCFFITTRKRSQMETFTADVCVRCLKALMLSFHLKMNFTTWIYHQLSLSPGHTHKHDSTAPILMFYCCPPDVSMLARSTTCLVSAFNHLSRYFQWNQSKQQKEQHTNLTLCVETWRGSVRVEGLPDLSWLWCVSLCCSITCCSLWSVSTQTHTHTCK